MYKNADALSRMVAAGDNSETFDMGSSSVVIECEDADVVWVPASQGGTFRASSQDYHAFSGFLLSHL